MIVHHGRFVAEDEVGILIGNLQRVRRIPAVAKPVPPAPSGDAEGTGFKSCEAALSDLARAMYNLSKDLAGAALRGHCPDPGHQKELEQRVTDLKYALQQVVKYCGPGGPGAAAAAAALKLLEEAAEYVPEALEGLAAASAL
jgi:hypothetical protein